MATKKHCLTLKFEKDSDNLLYNGKSYYKSNLLDDLKITENEITLTFERSIKKNLETCLTSPKSAERFQIQRALCCYYAVTGELPKLIELSLIVINEKEKVIAKEETDPVDFSQAWPKEKLYITMEESVIGKCVGSANKMPYVALSYFLKAQNDSFSNDCFRAAWSGLNAFYGSLLPTTGRECDKINELRKVMTKNTLNDSIQFIKGFSDEKFWSKLNWYVFVTESRWLKEKVFPVQGKKHKTPPKSIYEDPTLLFYFTKYLIGLEEKQIAEDEKTGLLSEKDKQLKTQALEAMKARADVMLKDQGANKNEEKNYKQQLEFLACDYCYKKRNRNYHGAVAFPIFSSSNLNHESIEMKLVSVLLYLIKDLLEEYENPAAEIAENK